MLPRHLIRQHKVAPEDVDALLPDTYRRRTRSERAREAAESEEENADDPDAVDDEEEDQDAGQVEPVADPDPAVGEPVVPAPVVAQANAPQVVVPDPVVQANIPPANQMALGIDPNTIDPNDVMYPWLHPVGIAEREADERAAAAAVAQVAAPQVLPDAVTNAPQAAADAAAPDAGNGQPVVQDPDPGSPDVERGMWVNPPSGERSTTSSGTYSPILPQVYVRASDVDLALRAANRSVAGTSGISAGVQQAAAAATNKKTTPTRKTPAKTAAKGKTPHVIR